MYLVFLFLLTLAALALGADCTFVRCELAAGARLAIGGAASGLSNGNGASSAHTVLVANTTELTKTAMLRKKFCIPIQPFSSSKLRRTLYPALTASKGYLNIRKRLKTEQKEDKSQQ
ncbi:hypothetical protein [Chitinibacter sp. GC72]|uniref:hypothetical protein n=1 Tax=Chitinibacter sp. GC72 TaxID=1526917 RepID=UPI0012FB8D6D|nr:hypothetical protein [Chitinibacter sp. GC72]